MINKSSYLLAIDSFKGCLSSRQANEAAAEGIRDIDPTARVTQVAVSDGGDGMLDAFASALGAQLVTVRVHDALMRPVMARYAISDTGVAIIEVAEACGLARLAPRERDPMRATSQGVGELVADAVRRGCRRLIVGLGGTATSDCGRGMMSVLQHVPTLNVTLASDVVNPLYGPDGAAAVYGPQKGATPSQVTRLDEEARATARRWAQETGRDCSDVPGAGAAGGLGYAFMQWFGARMESGAELLFRLNGFDKRLAKASCVITGEGGADRQTLMGKLPSVVLRHAMRMDVPAMLVAGRVADRESLLAAGFRKVVCINPDNLPPDKAMHPDVAQANIRRAVSQLLAIESQYQNTQRPFA